MDSLPGLGIAEAAAEGFGKGSANKLANAIGGLFPFWGIKKKAVETYINEIQNSNLSPEFKMMTIANTKKTFRHLSNQMKIAEIAQDVASNGTDFTENSGVDSEWLERFMDSAKFVSDEDLQLLWGRILAKEFEHPNSTPKSMIRILSEIKPEYAKAFEALCNCSVIIVSTKQTDILTAESFIILPVKYDYLSKYNINFSVLYELEALGLIQFDSSGSFVLQFDASISPKIHLFYGTTGATVTKYPDKCFPIGCVTLTDAGRAILRIVKAREIDGHFKEVVDYLMAYNVELTDKPEISLHIDK